MTRDLMWGVRWGLLGGSVVAVMAGVILLMKRDVDLGVSPVAVVLSYPAGGCFAGALTGLLRSRLTSRRNSTVIGVVVGIPTVFVLMPVAIGSPANWDAADLFGVVATGSLLGGFAGYKWWDLAAFDPDPVHDPARSGPKKSRSRRPAEKRKDRGVHK